MRRTPQVERFVELLVIGVLVAILVPMLVPGKNLTLTQWFDQLKNRHRYQQLVSLKDRIERNMIGRKTAEFPELFNGKPTISSPGSDYQYYYFAVTSSFASAKLVPYRYLETGDHLYVIVTVTGTTDEIFSVELGYTDY